ncbi:MAG: hypothetical protein JWM80_899 [Cyanobacteria bacterium RYN_339]|nr:hypothetical protein [Cyanobacteria bacterium RYN_339]
MPELEPILGITRAKDDPRGNATGLIHREGDRLKWSALADLDPTRFFRFLETTGKPLQQPLERIEFTVSGGARFLFRQTDGKLVQEELRDKLLFSEGKKALLKPQVLSKPVPVGTIALEYLEVSRLSDVMRKEMLGGERSLGQLAELLGISAADKALSETLWELSRQRYMTVHDSGAAPAENAIALNNPLPTLKGRS